MEFDVLALSDARRVMLCGSNVYVTPEYHPDRVMEEHDLLYVFEGIVPVIQDEVLYQVKRDDLILLRAGSHHYSTAPCSVNTRSLFIHFNRLPEDRSRVDIPAPATSRYTTGREICLPTLVHCEENSEVPFIFRQIIDVFWSRRDDQQRKLTMLLNLLLAEISYQSRRTPDMQHLDAWIVNLLQTLHTNITHFYTLDEAAELSHMHVRTFSDKFRKIMGKSLHQYQLDLKLELAYNALAGGQCTVKQVAEDYGFCDPYYFSRVFKSKYNISPSEIKRSNPAANIHRSLMYYTPQKDSRK